ncbi:Rho-binding antiterminator [Sulfurimonas hydrogeniphila]|uniref:Rho-binding antiterminator n=1 Tax=Sulfurimonas hydrogeniphila TaxID=2509341 RepID=UPI00125F4F73|nr:Rho-binding antiterminator [Sulfurimonas hydrogeniphila]
MISCQQYDYIEIACMYHYSVKLTMKSGSVFEGKALDTARNENHQECIKIKTENHEVLVVLDEISTLETAIKNPYFKIISFV